MGTLGSGLAWPRQAGLETGETADLEICATTKVVHPTGLAVYRKSQIGMTVSPDLSVVHVTSWLSRTGGGIPPVIWALARETKRMGSEAMVLGLKDEWTAADCLADEVPFSAEAVVGPRSIGFSPGLKARLEGRNACRGCVPDCL